MDSQNVNVVIYDDMLEIVNLDGKMSDLQLYIHSSGEVSVYFDDYDEPLFSGVIDIDDIIKLIKMMGLDRN